MPEISENNDIVTQITTVKVPPNHQAEVLKQLPAGSNPASGSDEPEAVFFGRRPLASPSP